MFILDEDHEFDWPVTIRKPVGVEDGAPRFEETTVTVRFKAMALDDWWEKVGEGTGEAMRSVVLGWSGIGAETDGKPAELPFSAEARDRLLRVGYIATAIFDAYTGALTGRAAKN